ncbi:MAG TPA: HNH endonuclease [Armatimonadota bacterium]|nr:HNH endonuclease [Armatimonadota bacterium]
MRADERIGLRQQFRLRCGYCGVSETDVGAELTVDHFQPLSQGGRDSPDNYVYCRHACNEFKGDYWQPDSKQRILHPLLDNLHDHLAVQNDGTMTGVTEAGTFHIQRLRLNRPELLKYRARQRLRRLARDRSAQLLRRLRYLELEIRDVIEMMSQLGTSTEED